MNEALSDMRLEEIIEKWGKRYSELLGINLSRARDDDIFKWFLASVLFGAPINESSALKTYRCFEKYDVLTPKAILKTGWDGLVKILDEGGYARYDFKTADKLLRIMQNLTEKYSGSLNLICEQVSDKTDLEKRLKALGKGVGSVTVSIFLRELRGIWSKADPKPTALVILAAENLRIIKKNASAEEALVQLKDYWSRNKVRDKSFIDFETALVRLGKKLRKASKTQ